MSLKVHSPSPIWSAIAFSISLFSMPCYSANAQTSTAPASLQPVQQTQTTIKRLVKPLEGGLDHTEMFNSNSPEVVKNSGILLSTFSSKDMAQPAAHQNKTLVGNVNFFLHHINNRVEARDDQSAYIALIIQNSSDKKAIVDILSAASHLSQPDAKFIPLPSIQANDDGSIYSGPGDRVMNEILRDEIDNQMFPNKVVLAPHQFALLLNQPIPVDGLQPPINGRSVLIKVRSSEPLYAATLANIQDKKLPPPSLSTWRTILKNGSLVTPREKAASAPEAPGSVIYGRAAGVQDGSNWQANLANDATGETYDINNLQTQSFVLATVAKGTFGTGQIQSAPFVSRYKDTAYAAHGNYGVHYKIVIPLYNSGNEVKPVSVAIENPIKNDTTQNSLTFNDVVSSKVFFRGTVKVTATSEKTLKSEVHFFHLVLHQGEKGSPIFSSLIAPSEKIVVTIEFLYPPDATPPQVLTIQ